MTGDYSQSTTDSSGGFGTTGVPGNTTSIDSIGPGYGGSSAGSGLGRSSDFERSNDRGPQVSSGDFSQSAPDSTGSYGSTGVPGNTTTDQTLGQTYDSNDSYNQSSGKPGLGQRVMGGLADALYRAMYKAI
jgi:hypothetical protein